MRPLALIAASALLGLMLTACAGNIPVRLASDIPLSVKPLDIGVSHDSRRIAIAAGAEGVLLMESAEPTRLTALRQADTPIDHVVFTKAGEVVGASSPMAALFRWDRGGGLVSVSALPGYDNEFNSLCCMAPSRGGTVFAVAGTRDKTVKTFDLGGNLLKSFEPAARKINAIAMARGGKYILAAQNSRLHREYPISVRKDTRDITVWRTDGTKVGSFGKHYAKGVMHRISLMAPNQSGKLIATADEAGGLIVWSLGGRRIIEDAPGFMSTTSARITGLSWSSKGGMLAVARGDGSVEIIRIVEGQIAQRAMLNAHAPGGETLLEWSPAGNTLYTAGPAARAYSLRAWAVTITP